MNLVRGHCRGLTLFEIAVSIMLLALCVTVVLAVLPAGLRVQEQVRFQQYASTLAMDVIDQFAHSTDTIDEFVMLEDPKPYETTAGHWSRAPSLENRLATMKGRLLPIPPAIARRIDSPGDVIGRILAEGGQVYYPTPYPGINMPATVQNVQRQAPESRRVIVGIVGAPQLDQIEAFHHKNVPYYGAWPAGPAGLDAGGDEWTRNQYRWVWESVDDDHPAGEPEALEVFYTYLEPAEGVATEYNVTNAGRRFEGIAPADVTYENLSGFLAYQWAERTKGEQARRLYALARWYAGRPTVSIASPWSDGSAEVSEADIDTLLASADCHRKVKAVRYLASAAAALTRWHDATALTSGVDCIADTNAEFSFANITEIPAGYRGTPLGRPRVTLQQVRNHHQNAMRLGMAFAARRPYDWGSIRPINRPQMNDVPLLQWDPYTSAANLHQGPILGTPDASIGLPAATGRQWRAVAAQPVLNLGVSRSVPLAPAGTYPWGSPSSFTLADRFDPSERCRQIVVWAADWQSYEDFESAASAPVDASRYHLRGATDAKVDFAIREDDEECIMDWRMGFGKCTMYDFCQSLYRNPEKLLLFGRPMTAADTGQDVVADILDADQLLDRTKWGVTRPAGTQPQAPDVGTELAARRIFVGTYGADRNNNRRFDRGPLPSQVRLRATEIARFNVYDPRLNLILR